MNKETGSDERNKLHNNKVSKIDDIQLSDKDDSIDDIIKKIRLKKNKIDTPFKNEKTGKDRADGIKDFPETISTHHNQDEQKIIYEDIAESIEDAEELEMVAELEPMEEDSLDYLVERIDKEENKVRYPGKIKITDVDKNLKNISEGKNEEPDPDKDDFGVNKVEVFYNIDKKIYSSRSNFISSKSKIRGIKKGLFLPIAIAISLFITTLVVSILFSVYFKITQNDTFEDMLQKDNSILAKINERQKEESRLAREKLDEERKRLEEEKKNFKNIINEELLKKQADIENMFKKRLEELKKQGISLEEREKLEKELERQKNLAYEEARKERDAKLQEQAKQLEDKESKLNDYMAKLKEESQNKEQQLEELKRQIEQKKNEEEILRKQAQEKFQEISANQEKIKNFNTKIYQLISNAMEDFKDGNYDDSSIKLGSVLDFYERNNEFVNANNELKNKKDTDIFFVEAIKGLVNQGKTDKNFNKEYSAIINKFEKLTNYYKNAEMYYNEKKYQNSMQEYEKALEQFEQINDSYKKINELEKIDQNKKARILYDSAKDNLKSLKYEIALAQFSSIIKDTPLSDYTNQAMNEILKITQELSSTEKVKQDNEKAKVLFADAEKLKKENKNKEALQLYQKIITNYPYSDFTKRSLEASIELNSVINNRQYEDYAENIKKKFDEKYKRFLDENKNGNIEQARIYYFDALKNAFNIYSNNSIDEFKKIEDEYIENLISKQKNNSQLTDEERKKLAQLEKEKEELNKKYQELTEKLKNAPVENKNELADKFKKELDLKDQEIVRLRDYIKEKENKYTTNEIEKKISDYQEQLRVEKDKSETLKKQLYDYYKKTTDLDIEKEKAMKLQQELTNTKKELEELEKKYNEKAISKKDKEKIEKEIMLSLEKKYDLEKKNEIEKEKIKLRKEYQDQIKKLKEQINNNNLNNESANKNKEFKNQIFGRITDIINESIAFQFISINPGSGTKIDIGEEVKIVRLTREDNAYKEILVGYAQITSIEKASQYGRARVISYVKGYNIENGDLLKD